MRAIQVESLGGPRAARLIDVARPEPGAGEVLVRVRAAGINYADVMQSLGEYVNGPAAPYIAGLEAAGEVVAVGAGAQLAEGARVMGFGTAAFAEFVSWPATNLFPVPEAWSFGQAASFPVQWLTAHGCLRVCGRLKAGETVLIHAAAGGVGTAAVRLAKRYGARVIAAASSAAKLELARRHGAQELIDTSRQDFVAEVKRITAGRGADLILEMVGGETFDRNFEAAVPFGRIVVYGAASGALASVSNRQMIFRPVELIGYHIVGMAVNRPDLLQRDLEEVFALIAAGVIVPDEPTSYALEQAPEALSALQARKTTGKLVLTI